MQRTTSSSSANVFPLPKVTGPGITPTHVFDGRGRWRRAHRMTMAFALIAGAAAQVPPPISDPNASNPIMGFETTEGWIVRSGSIATRVSSTTTRTQGSLALALVNPPNLTTLTSLPVPSTAGALAGVGDLGAIFEVDVMLPARNTGSLKLSVSSPSRGFKNELAGEVELTAFRPGIYNTLKFPVPDKVRSALKDTSFNDLTFEIALNEPASSLPVTPAPRQFLFDNLRVHSVPLVAAKAGSKPLAGFGGSVDLVAIGEAPATQSFHIGAVQVPDNFHLEQGAAGTTRVKLALGLDGNAAFTCTYGADLTDKSGESYALESCTDGVKAGDLVGANFAQLTILDGASSMKVRAQLAKNPVGDLVGGDLIPPMPTFWGNFDGCLPLPVPGKVHTTSPSCATQTAEANQIVTGYFNKVNLSGAAPNWIVTPTPDLARRHGNGLPNPNQPGKAPSQLNATHLAAASPRFSPLSPTPQQNDIPFDQEGHMNPGGDFDAFWRLNGDLNFNNDPSTGNSSTHFDASFSGHVVLYGQDVNVVSLNAAADTTSGSSPSANGSLHMFLFGQELPGGGSADASTGFGFNITQSQDFDLPPIPIWIFSITPGATASIGVVASGTLAATGISLAVTPQASLGVHVLGGVDIPGQVSGGVDARIDLLDVTAPVTAQAGWSIDTLPQRCDATVDFAFRGSVDISAGGGEVDLVATFGPCPLCYSDSWTLFSWPPLLSTTLPLFDVGPTTLAAIPLPQFLCTAPLNVAITSPPANAIEGLAYPLNSFVTSPNSSTVDCSNFQWSVSPKEPMTPPSGLGCNVSIVFNTKGTHTLSLKAVANFLNPFGTIQETGFASESVTVTDLPPGTYITGTNPVDLDGLTPPFNGKTLSFQVGRFPAVIQLTGEEIDAPCLRICTLGGTTNTWTVTDSSGNTISLGTGLNVNWTVPTNGLYSVTLTTTNSSFGVVGTATMIADVELRLR